LIFKKNFASPKKDKKKRKKEENEAPMPNKIQLVLDNFCTMKKLTMHLSLVPFFTPCHVTDEGKLKAYIAPVNHNNISENMVVDVCNIIMGDYCGSDNSHMQEMGDDAGVIVGWDEGIKVSFF
jgi:hypothetical protein